MELLYLPVSFYSLLLFCVLFSFSNFPEALYGYSFINKIILVHVSFHLMCVTLCHNIPHNLPCLDNVMYVQTEYQP